MMMIFKCWEWLRIFGDRSSLPPTPTTPHSSSSSSSSLVPAELCDDVLINILLRVPPDVLSRFKCVSTQSYRLINDPDFDKKYRSQLPDHPNQLIGLYYHHHQCNHVSFANPNPNEGVFQCIDKSLSFFPNPVRMLASRHGLILCISTKPNPVRYYICNPITRKFAILPETKGPSDSYSTGFFVDRKYGHYKVIKIPGLAARNTFAFVETFSSESGKWRLLKLELSSPYCLFSHMWPAIQWNGSLHWVDGLGSILTYDVTEEKFKFLEIPCVDVRNQRPYKRVVIKYGVLGVSEGLLSYAFSDAYMLHVWVRVRDCWVVMWRVSLVSMVSKNLEVLTRLMGNLRFENGMGQMGRLLQLKPVCFNEFDRTVVFLRVPGWIVSYHFENGKIEAIQDHSEEHKFEVAFPYVVPQLPFTVEFNR
ncbi:unnamed protein product [Camellia sinensis]